MSTTTFPDNVRINGNLQVNGELQPARDRSHLLQEENAVYAVPLTLFRVWDALQTNLPGTAATDDLALITGTLGTDQPTIEAGDVKATSGTRYARAQIPLPVEYVAAQTVTIRLNGHVTTTVADTSCTVDVQAYRVGRDGTVGSDICATAAQSINSLSAANKDFTITPASLSPGDLLDVRIAIIWVDGATGTAVVPTINAVELLADVKG